MISRNNLYYETFYRLILKKSNPALTKCYSIYYGVKFKIEYMPLVVVILLNVLGFGPSWWCYQNILPSNINFIDGKFGWWIMIIYFIGEIITDFASEGLFALLVKCNVIEKDSHSHTITFVKTYYIETAVMYAMFSMVIWSSLLYDCGIRCNYDNL